MAVYHCRARIRMQNANFVNVMVPSSIVVRSSLPPTPGLCPRSWSRCKGRRWPYHGMTIRGWWIARPAPLVFARTSPLWVTRAKLRVVSRSAHPGSRPRCRSPPPISVRMLLSRQPWHGIGNRTGILVPWYALASAWCEVALSHTSEGCSPQFSCIGLRPV